MSRATTKSHRGTIADDYLALVRRFPLRPIRTARDYDRATMVLADLLGRADSGLTLPESDYADVLSRLVKDYDEAHSSLLRDKRGDRSVIGTLKYLMQEHRMNTVSLGKLVGGSGQASMILSGKRELSKANIRTLAEHFNVSPALFI